MMKAGTYLICMAAAILAAVSCNIQDAILYSDEENTVSPYDKNVDFGFVPATYYVGQQDDYSFGKASTRTADIYEQFDLLADGSYISRENIGKASDGSDMYMYRLTSPTPSFSGSASKRPTGNKLKIIIICAQHGFEKSSIYGTYYFIKDLKEKYMEHEVLKYFRQYADFLIIPCTNPYGIDNQGYVNAHGANLNRNWPVERWTKVRDAKPGQSEYGGEEGGDQPEVKNIVKVLKENKDALLVLDFHTNGSGKVEKKSLNWISMTLPDDYYRNLLITVGNYHLCSISSAFEAMYPSEIGSEETICGYMDGTDHFSRTGYLSTYAAQQNFLSLTFEGFNGFPHDTVYSENAKKANSELLGNYLATLCGVLGNFRNQ
jgi:hypothetical protein